MTMPNNHLMTRFISRRAVLRRSLQFAALSTVRNIAPRLAGAQEQTAVHNCMLVGAQTAFLSHLPMFERLNKTGTDYLSPHRFQVILEVFFTAGDRDLTPLYLQERRAHPEVKMFTVSPTPFVLTRLSTSSPITSFQATVFRGHLERGGKPIRGLDGVRVNVRRLIHFRKFDPAANAAGSLEYLLFGSEQEMFLAHSIAKPPDFDQILSVDVTGTQLTGDQLSQALQIVVPNRGSTPLERIREGQQVTAKTRDGKTLTIRALREFYFEEGELQIPPTFDPTPEETRSGFSE
jgi:hypothetical protein